MTTVTSTGSASVSQYAAKLQRENTTAGDYTGDAFMEALSHYNALSPIRQATYPVGYADELKSQIQPY